MSKKSCFIVMPISTPKSFVEKYNSDVGHFKHVLDFLFIPAIKAAGFDPIPPITKGSDIIHAEIIKNLEEADLVLVDMSILNPNVFFEMGIRTALNKPVSLVVDDSNVEDVPFDLSIINYHKYNSLVAPWTLEEGVPSLTEHIKDCAEKTPDNNALWRIFGMQEAGRKSTENTNKESLEIDLLKLQLSSMTKKIDDILSRTSPIIPGVTTHVPRYTDFLNPSGHVYVTDPSLYRDSNSTISVILKAAADIIAIQEPDKSLTFKTDIKGNILTVTTEKIQLNDITLLELQNLAAASDLKLEIVKVDKIE